MEQAHGEKIQNRSFELRALTKVLHVEVCVQLLEDSVCVCFLFQAIKMLFEVGN